MCHFTCVLVVFLIKIPSFLIILCYVSTYCLWIHFTIAILGKASSALQSFGPSHYKNRGKDKKLMRTAGGQTWEDLSLADWPEDDFRIFCGDLGNDVTDELLTRTFNKYPSFIRARVVRDKRTNKSKGYGFISFKDPADFTKAMKEMNGKLLPHCILL